MFPVIDTEEEARKLLAGVDALVMTGGSDINPRYYGEEPSEKLGTVNDALDVSEMLLLKEALKMDMPILAICRGMQLLNVVQGGTLYQDIPSEIGTDVAHKSATHSIFIENDTKLSELFEKTEIEVSSSHHQALEKLGENLIVTAKAEDGVVEAVELKGKTYVLGVQFHPEAYAVRNNWEQLELFEELKAEAQKYQEKIFVNSACPATVSAELYGHDDVKVSWEKVKNASGYRVDYKKSTADNYITLGYYTGTQIKKANLTDGCKYIFKIVPYIKIDGKKEYSKKYETVSIYTLKKVSTPKVVKSSHNYVKVSWTNINGERGYQISRSTSKTGTNILTTFKSSSATNRKVKAIKNKTYYYKVRAYQRTVNGKKVYGPWSNTVSYKMK